MITETFPKLLDARSALSYSSLVPLENARWEIGYHIAKQYTGNGYATEAVRAFLPVIAKAVGIDEIHGICLSENTASRRVLLKCGFSPVFEGAGVYHGEKRGIFTGIWKLPPE